MARTSTTPRILLIGAGGIGCGAALALGAAGQPDIGVIDDDTVDLSNLQRQVLHSERTLGQSKTTSLAVHLHERYPRTHVAIHAGRLRADNALALFASYDVVIDGSDNLATKFLANDAAVLARKPLIHAAAVGILGHLLTVPAGGRPCYRCLFEEPPAATAEVAPSCADAGVLGPLPGAIGALAAREALMLLAGQTPPSTGRLFRYDSHPMTLRHVRFRANPGCRVCGHAPTITSLLARNYPNEEYC